MREAAPRPPRTFDSAYGPSFSRLAVAPDATLCMKACTSRAVTASAGMAPSSGFTWASMRLRSVAMVDGFFGRRARRSSSVGRAAR